MTTITIPEWNTKGLLPPINPVQPTSAERSPYPVALLDVVMRFAASAERRKVLLGLLDFRAALHGMGLVDGFQWLDGSFIEQVERLENRAPRDVDVVTFVNVPDGFAPSDEALAALDHDIVKEQFLVDSYLVELNLLPTDNLVRKSAYWYSIWSHRRNQDWKGYLQVDLNPIHDKEARSYLIRVDNAGAWS